MALSGKRKRSGRETSAPRRRGDGKGRREERTTGHPRGGDVGDMGDVDGMGDGASRAGSKRRRRRGRRYDGEGDRRPPSPSLPSTLSSTSTSSSSKTFAQDELVGRISLFLSSSTATNGGDDHGESAASAVDSATSYLIEYLEDSKSGRRADAVVGVGGGGRGQGGQAGMVGNADCSTSAQHVALTRADVASLLLPWSVSRLVRRSVGGVRDDEGADSNSDSEGDAMEEEEEEEDGTDGREEEAVAWRALSCCLDVLSSTTGGGRGAGEAETAEAIETAEGMDAGVGGEEEATLSSSLSQGALSRLVPYALRVALSSSSSSSSSSKVQTMQRHSSNAYCLLVGRYRPSLDVACDQLLRAVDDLVVRTMHVDGGGGAKNVAKVVRLPSHHERVVVATLTSVRALVASGNPKRTFGRVCSADVLPTLGRLGNVVAAAAPTTGGGEEAGGEVEGTTTTEAAAAQAAGTIVRRVLRDGLLSPAHHLDGYRTTRELREHPSLPTFDVMESDDEDAAMVEGDEDAERQNEIEEEANEKEGGRGAGAKPPRRQYSCYQSALFESLRTLLSVEEDGGEGDESTSHPGDRSSAPEKRRRDPAAVACALPEIVRGYFEGVAPLSATCATTASSTSRSEDGAALLFRFWRGATLPAFMALFRTMKRCRSAEDLKHDDSGLLVASLMDATSETLGLVLRHDAYSPSYVDPGGHHLAFLEWTSRGLLGCARRLGSWPRSEEGGAANDAPSSVMGGVRAALETSLRRILLLNHRLLHDELATVVSFACSGLPRSDANDLLCALVTTYRELRQVGYFLISTKKAFGAGQGGSMSINNLLKCGAVMESLSIAYQRSIPSGQLAEIWNFFDEWIASTAVQNPAEASEPLEIVVPFAVQMFILFIKNTRTNKQNSTALRTLCDKSATSISKLVGGTNKGSSHSPFMSHGLDVFGWLVDLHTRSCFWIDDINVDRGGSSFLTSQSNNSSAGELNVLSYLLGKAETTVASEHFIQWKESWLSTFWRLKLEDRRDIDVALSLRGSLLRLAMHRIQQLHSMIYYCNLRENERSESDDEEDPSVSSEALVREARLLLDFSLYIACSQITGSACKYDAIYEQSESWWSCVAQSLSTWVHYADEFHVELFLIWFFSTLCQNDPTCSPSRHIEKAITLTLARDASFYDTSKVMSMFMRIGIRFAFTRFVDSIETTSDRPETILEDCKELTLPCVELGKVADITLSNSDSVAVVSRALSFLASVPLEFSLSNENMILLDQIVGLDALACQVFMKAQREKREHPELLNIVRLTKILLSNILPSITLLASDKGAPCLHYLQEKLPTMCLDIGFDYDVASAYGVAQSEFFSMCVDQHESNDSMLVKFLDQMVNLVQSDTMKDMGSSSVCIRSVIRRMNILSDHHVLKKTAASANFSSYGLCLKFVVECHKHLRGPMIERISEAKEVATTALLLASEIYTFLGKYLSASTASSNVSLTCEQKSSVKGDIQQVLNLIRDAQGKPQEASNYFMASIATIGGISLLALESILEALARSGRRNCTLLESAICSLIRDSSLDETKLIVDFALEEADHGKGSRTSISVKLFYSLVMCANSPDQNQYLSGKAKVFLLISMDLLRDTSCDASRRALNVDLFTKTITTLISKKELFLFSGREISMICCEMSSLFYGDHGGIIGDVVSDIRFSSCCSIVASFVANYPKQLYGCPSPLFSLMLALLTYLLNVHPKSGLHQKALEYAKVCELLIPHKDIFKKHVVGLVLCYIRALNRGMNSTTKSRLTPSINALLDMCSDFETRQINAMIDVSSKALFAPVFQSYQKFYQYHGQA